jgi:hypothetical protein
VSTRAANGKNDTRILLADAKFCDSQWTSRELLRPLVVGLQRRGEEVGRGEAPERSPLLCDFEDLSLTG